MRRLTRSSKRSLPKSVRSKGSDRRHDLSESGSKKEAAIAIADALRVIDIWVTHGLLPVDRAVLSHWVDATAATSPAVARPRLGLQCLANLNLVHVIEVNQIVPSSDLAQAVRVPATARKPIGL